MRRGRVILERRSLLYSSSTSIGAASPANPRPLLPRRVSSTVRPASFARPTRPRSAPSSRTVAPIRPRAPPTAQPFTPTPLQSIDPFRPTSSPGRGRGRRSANVPYVSPAFREASQAARQARSVNDRSGQDAPSSSRRRVRLSSEDFDSDDQPLAQRLRRRAPDPSQDSSPSAVPPPPPPVTTPTPAPGQADASPAPPEVQVEPPLAQPSTSQQHQSTEAGPSHRSSPATSPPEPSQVPPAAPSGSAAGPSQPPLPVPLYYCTTAPSEADLQSRQDVPTSSLTMKGRLATLWEEKSLMINQSFQVVHHQNKMLQDMITELELQLKDPAQASHALRAEIKDLTKKKNHLEVSLAHTNHKLKGLQEEKSQVDTVHQQRIDQQTLEHQRAIDQLTQKLCAAETLAQEQDKKLKSQAAHLKSQAAALLAAQIELAQARATTEGVSTALTIYKEGENNRYKQSRDLYLRSPEFYTQAGQRFSTSVIYGAAGALRQLYEQGYLKSAPTEFLDHDRILKEIPDKIFAPFK
ncbi:serine/arginine repetitive matrix protein 1-like [Zingiber officinale]|uniref:serine/arginine repetitive matrix protein 1-like n=1 Tax=Zingiber officinale TaxID=94328 RepID=UPI001C4AE114|nr:serine/arginine repetitive matrix protein 1-like [Zingiber officinale]